MIEKSEVSFNARRLECKFSADVHGLEGLARFLLRSEAIVSSKIEGLQVSAQQIAPAASGNTGFWNWELAEAGRATRACPQF